MENIDTIKRKKLIQNIEALYPTDSQWNKTNEIGKQLLLEAIFENWRTLPIEILRTYSYKCDLIERNDR